jgi:hypothetical protein
MRLLRKTLRNVFAVDQTFLIEKYGDGCFHWNSAAARFVSRSV